MWRSVNTNRNSHSSPDKELSSIDISSSPCRPSIHLRLRYHSSAAESSVFFHLETCCSLGASSKLDQSQISLPKTRHRVVLDSSWTMSSAVVAEDSLSKWISMRRHRCCCCWLWSSTKLYLACPTGTEGENEVDRWWRSVTYDGGDDGDDVDDDGFDADIAIEERVSSDWPLERIAYRAATNSSKTQHLPVEANIEEKHWVNWRHLELTIERKTTCCQYARLSRN